RVPILATGSAAVKETARPTEVPNQYQVVRFQPDRLVRWARAYVPGQRRWVGDTSASPAGDLWRTEESVAFDLPQPDSSPPPAPEPAARRHTLGDFLDDFKRRDRDDLLARVDRICRLEAENRIVERLSVG